MWDHDTKGAIQFKQEDVPGGQRAEIGSIYLTKVAVKDLGLGKHIEVTVRNRG